jgi:hypothetical protein
MTTLTRDAMVEIRGGGFWSGFGCGLGLATAFVVFTSPDPFSKLALLGYGGALLGCITLL